MGWIFSPWTYSASMSFCSWPQCPYCPALFPSSTCGNRFLCQPCLRCLRSSACLSFLWCPHLGALLYCCCVLWWSWHHLLQHCYVTPSPLFTFPCSPHLLCKPCVQWVGVFWIFSRPTNWFRNQMAIEECCLFFQGMSVFSAVVALAVSLMSQMISMSLFFLYQSVFLGTISFIPSSVMALCS